MKRREPTQGEIKLWEEVTREVVPVKRTRRKPAPAVPSQPARAGGGSAGARKTDTPGLPHATAVVERGRLAAPQRLDGSTLRRLSEGKVEPDAKIDLHGLTQVQAHARLVTFIHRAHANGLRCVLVVTGKGTARDGGETGAANWMHDGTRGLLRSLVPRWLAEGDLKGQVTGLAGAHVRHGGGGAIYVYLKRNRSKPA